MSNQLFNMQQFQAVLFDLDGTIIDTEDMWAEATKQMLEARSITYTTQIKHEIHALVHGLDPVQANIKIKDRFNLPDCPQALAQEKKERAYLLMKGRIQFIPGFISFYERIKTTGAKTAIVTNCPIDFIDLADQALNLRSLFGNALYHPEHVSGKTKPDPALYIYATKQLDVMPKACLAIEDSAPGIAAAKAAGIYCIGINTAQCKNNVMHADKIIENYSEHIVK